jgi:AraC family transcriptional regulator
MPNDGRVYVAEPSAVARPLIWPESCWRSHPAQNQITALGPSSAFLSRCIIHVQEEPFELRNDEPDTSYMLTINLRSSDFDIKCGAFSLRAAHLAPYDMWTTGPRREPISGLIKRSAEVFRIVLPEPLVRECFETVYDRYPAEGSVLIPTRFVKDKFVKRLFMSLYEAAASPAPYAGPLIDAAGLVLASRLVVLDATHLAKPMPEIRRLRQGLLKLVTEYIEENLESPIYVADLSAVAGMSRNHFAAQFKAATQYSPHSYILSRRIARAKELLLKKECDLANVALHSGFCNQPHFTQVFRRLTGQTPGQWRRGR